MFDLVATFITVLLLALFIMVFLPVAFGQVAKALLEDINLEHSDGTAQEDTKITPIAGSLSPYDGDGEIRLEPLSFAVKHLHFHDCQAVESRANRLSLHSQHSAQDMTV